MSYENLDPQDKEICEALERGVAVEEICAQLGVEVSKVESLKSVVLENAGAEVSQPEVTSDVNEVAEEVGGKGFDVDSGFQG